MRGGRRRPRVHPLRSYARPLPSSPCNWQSGPNTQRVYDKLGIDGNKVPKTMHGVFKVDGWTVRVKRAGPDARGGKPRIFVDHGGREVPIGRVYQALCRVDIHHARKRAKANRGPKGKFTYKTRSR